MGKTQQGGVVRIKELKGTQPSDKMGLCIKQVKADLSRLEGELGGRNKKAPERRMDTGVLAETESAKY